MGYRCKYFIIQELVTPALFAARGDACWDMLDAKLLITIDEMRSCYGPLKINDWHIGGSFKESGSRDFDTPTGAKYSMHKYLRAADLKPLKVSPVEMQRDIMAHPDRFPMLTTMEDAGVTKTWLHVDVRNHNQQSQIWIVQP